jgi:hypothetical protein
MRERVARGSLNGRWAPRADGSPNLRGAITLETDMKAGDRLWLSGWTRSAGGGVEFVSLTATRAHGGPRKRTRRSAGYEDAEPEGKFRHVGGPRLVPMETKL